MFPERATKAAYQAHYNQPRLRPPSFNYASRRLEHNYRPATRGGWSIYGRARSADGPTGFEAGSGDRDSTEREGSEMGPA